MAQEQEVVTELLATRQVKVAIGKRLGEGSTQISPALPTLTTSTPGPQVLQFSLAGATPVAATTTLSAALTELQQASAPLIAQHAVDAVSYAKAQVQQANQALSAARNQVNAYQRQHPGATGADPTYASLTQAEANADSRLAQDTVSLNTAEGAALQSPSGFSVRVIDPPTPPYASGGGKKNQVEGLLGGLLAGALISLLGTIALTRGKPDPWDDELAKGSTAAGEGTTLDHGSVGTDVSDGALATSAHGNGLVDAAGGGSAEGKVSARHHLPVFTNIADSSDRGSNRRALMTTWGYALLAVFVVIGLTDRVRWGNASHRLTSSKASRLVVIMAAIVLAYEFAKYGALRP